MRQKILTVSILFLVSTFSFAQQASTNNKKALADAAWARAGCGPDDIHFDVKMDKSQNALAQPASGKALVYVFEDDLTSGGLPTTRVGLDGKWAGANIPDSKMGAARDLTFEAGKIYFFRVTIAASGNEAFILDQVPEAEGHFLIATHRLSASSAKPQNGDE
jgi:hypothetical protein